MSNSNDELGEKLNDRLAGTLRGLSGLIPVIGSLVSEAVTKIIPNQRIDRVCNFLAAVEERVKSIEADVLHEKLSSEFGIGLLEESLPQAARANTQQRIDNLASIFANGLIDDEASEAVTKRLLWLLDQLNDTEVVILRGHLVTTLDEEYADSAFRDLHGHLLYPPVVHLGSSDEEINRASLHESYVAKLFQLGLLENRQSTNGTDVSHLGKLLLQHLNQLPGWYLGEPQPEQQEVGNEL